MTSLQEEPSAQAPCTSTTLRACAGLEDCANACAAKSIAGIMPRATTVNFRSVVIVRFSKVKPLLPSAGTTRVPPTSSQGGSRKRYRGGIAMVTCTAGCY